MIVSRADEANCSDCQSRRSQSFSRNEPGLAVEFLYRTLIRPCSPAADERVTEWVRNTQKKVFIYPGTLGVRRSNTGGNVLALKSKSRYRILKAFQGHK
jgi:hypothetical protein